MVLVLEAGPEEGVDLQGIVVRCQLEGQRGVAPFLKALVGIQYLHGRMERRGASTDDGTEEVENNQINVKDVLKHVLNPLEPNGGLSDC